MEPLDKPCWIAKSTTFVCDGTDLTPVSSAEAAIVGGLRQIMEATVLR